MKNKKIVLLSVFVFLFIGLLAMMAQKTNFPTQEQKPKVSSLTCADINVSSFKATLASTQLRDPLAEFPHDTVWLEVIVENSGGRPVPGGYSMSVEFFKNGTQFNFRQFVSPLGAPGTRKVIRITDSFPHGVKTAYSVRVTPLYNECTTENNQASFTIDEAQLHKSIPQFPQHR